MVRKRPVNLNLLNLSFPLSAWVSIAHRLSGLFLIFCIPFLLLALKTSLSSETEFTQLKLSLNQPTTRIIGWMILSALGYHLMSGIRHLLMDMCVGDSLRGSRLTAKITVFLSSLIAMAGGYWIWWK